MTSRWTVAATLGAVLAARLAASGPVDPGYEAEVLKWRSAREERLKGDGGWLTVAGLFWLKDGANRFGSARSNDIVLPASAPAVAGVFEHRDRRITVRIEPGVLASVGGKPVTALELAPDTSGKPDVVSLGPLTLHVIERGGRYAIRLKDADRPERRAFKGLRWFPVKESYRLTARFVAYDSPHAISVPNILGQVEEMPSPGAAVFSVAGREVRLDGVLEEPDAEQIFFIFRDLTTGKETYPAGRFLYADKPRNGVIVLDFNKAYSPPCAFTPFATCPLPPKQNRLPVRIDAGEIHSGQH